MSTCMDVKLCINGFLHKRRKEKQERKREREEKRESERRKERKRKRKRERGRRSAVSSSVHWHPAGRNSLDQGVKSGDSTRGYTSRGRDSSYFGLLLAFGLLFWANFGTLLCYVNGMGWVCSRFKRLLPERIWVEKLHLRDFPKCSCNPRAHYCVDWRNSVAPSVLQLRTTISFSSKLRFSRS